MMASPVSGALEALAGVDLAEETVFLGPPWRDVGAMEAERMAGGGTRSGEDRHGVGPVTFGNVYNEKTPAVRRALSVLSL